MGSFRFRKSVKIAPGIRLNFNKKSIGLSGGVPGARISINSNGRSTRSAGIPGTGLFYRTQTAPKRQAQPRNHERGQTVIDPLAGIDEEELWLSVVMGHFQDNRTRTVNQILEADAKMTAASRLDPTNPAARRLQEQFGATPQHYDELQRQMDIENMQEFAARLPGALNELMRRGLLTHLGDTYTVTPEGAAYLKAQETASASAAAAQGSTPEARQYILSLLGAAGGSLFDVIGRSKEDEGFGLERAWAQLNLNELVARSEVELVGDRYVPTGR